ncbi:hypothetical protein FAES_5422 [Fibrella aestuarina BUZ 2]|uniref:Uncharacterized protein n=1 Tax=Fibrella aestuarina BUZ 2 TaxID=1166018 RepID=I0KH18_9BACT|nr:hypothetical protein [Fibrella aestuarina]CCH03421.1 hypothetical protein FAES_5422 [Fibrella aestuarina BUZ 2]
MKKSEAQHVQIAIGALIGEVVLTTVLFSSANGVLILLLLVFLAVFAVGCWNMVTYIIRSSCQENVRLGLLISTLLPLAYLVFLVAYIASDIVVD